MKSTIHSQVWLIRHAQSTGNVGLPSDSPGSIPLTATGHTQAKTLAESIETSPDLIVVSPYLRTQQTAAPLITLHPEVQVEEWPVHEFTYLNTQTHAGTTEAQRRVFAQTYWERCDPDWRDGTDAESFVEFIRRIDALELSLRKRPGLRIMIFTHGYFIKGFILRRQHPAADVDHAFMAAFRDNRRNNLPRNTEVVELET
jgi:broad specificity phosphatase PhoE